MCQEFFSFFTFKLFFSIAQINATVYGWGLRNEDGPLQSKLYNLTIFLKTDQECASDYDHETFYPQSMICAGSVNNGPCSVRHIKACIFKMKRIGI